MVRLSPSPVSLCSGGAKKRQGTPQNGPPAPQCSQATPDTPHPYETQDPFIADALTFLKHKIRNIEKKKIKLEDYRKRVKEGEKLNPDQMNAVERYREVGHNLSFATDLQKTLSALSQDLLKAQRKVLRRAQVLRAEQEQQQLSTMLRIRHIMQKVQQEHVRKDLCTAQKHAHFLPDYQRSHAHFLSAHEESHTPFLSAQDLGHLLRLAPLLGLQRDDSMSFGAQMERASSTYQALLEGGDSPVAGSTYGYMKELLARLVQCGYFDHIPVPRSQSLGNAVSLETSTTEAPGKPPAGPSQLTIPDEMPHREVLKRCRLLETDIHGKGWNGDLPGLPQDRKEELEQQKLQGCWEMEFMGRRAFLQSDTQRPQEGAGFPCKEQRPAAEYKQATEAAAPAEGWSPLPYPAPTLSQTPGAQEDQLQLLLKQTQGTFTFLQTEKILLQVAAQVCQHLQLDPPMPQNRGSQRQTKRPASLQHWHPLPHHLLSPNEDKTSPTDRGEPAGSPTDSTNDVLITPSLSDDIHQSESGGFMSLPLQCRDSTPSISVAQNAGDQEEFKVDAPLMSGSDSDAELEVGGVSCHVGVSTASTQTPPSPRPPGQQALQPGIDLVWQHCHGNQSVASYQSECPIADGYQVYLCPGPPVGLYPFYETAFYTRAAVQGRTRSGRVRGLSTHSPARHKGLLEGHRAGPWCFGGGQAPRSVRDAALVQFRARTGSQQSPGQGSGSSAGEPRNPCGASWSDSIQLGNPDRDRPPCIASTGNGSGRGNSGYATPKTTPGPSLSPTLQVHRLAPPLRVAFSAARTANFTPGTLDQTITFDLLLSNLGEAFQPHLGRFTCPVSGTYVFIFHMLKLAVSAPLYVNLMRNEEVAVSAYANDGAPDHETASNHALLQLCLGDSVWLRLHRGAIYGSSWKYSTFSGYLLYQD
ncbi:hypothetical protein AGOR_G00230620 [Albula goreensis]|uniref:C1q domain-containing protein n=1 Tax=Albula goreensis TaxID=1534307 RepID=A0A8T3CHU1_9TELE|nr:hypothetical protein AGOR_G00230620 [Albula goreensis]